jgi:hypothetical protein
VVAVRRERVVGESGRRGAERDNRQWSHVWEVVRGLGVCNFELHRRCWEAERLRWELCRCILVYHFTNYARSLSI